MADNENLGAPQSRNEALLQNILGANYDLGEPQSRNEALLMKIAGEDVDVDFEPQSRIEVLLKEIIDNGGTGGGVEVESLSVTENGTYTAPSGVGYSPVTVNVSGGGSSYVTDGLYDYIDFTDLERWSSGEYTGINNKLVMKPDTDSGSRAVGGGADGAINTTICPSIPSGDLPFSDGVSIEITIESNQYYSTNGYRVIGTCKNNNSYTDDVGINNAEQMEIPYYKTGHVSATIYNPSSAIGAKIYTKGLHHVVLIRTNTSAKWYLDDMLIGEQIFSNLTDYESMKHTELDKFTIAGIWSNSDAIVVKSCRVYKKALSTSEIHTNFMYERDKYFANPDAVLNALLEG